MHALIRFLKILKMNNRIVIITPFYNPGEFLDRCISSLITQKYDNFHIYFVDDASTDGSFDKLPLGHPNVTVITNQERKTALENLHFVLVNHCLLVIDNFFDCDNKIR